MIPCFFGAFLFPIFIGTFAGSLENNRFVLLGLGWPHSRGGDLVETLDATALKLILVGKKFSVVKSIIDPSLGFVFEYSPYG